MSAAESFRSGSKDLMLRCFTITHDLPKALHDDFKVYRQWFRQQKTPTGVDTADAPVDPMKTKSRRSELQRFMVWLLPPWNQRLREQWRVAEQKACADLASTGCKSISEPWFEFEVDKIVYLHFFKLFKECFKCEVPGWPWEEISPKDVTTQQDKNSSVYDRSLRKQTVAAITAEKNESAMEGIEGPATENPSAASSKLNPEAPTYEPNTEAPTSEQGQAPTLEQGANRGRVKRKTKYLSDSMFARGRGSHQSEIHHELPPQEDEFEWKDGDQMSSDQNNQILGTPGSQVTDVNQQDIQNDIFSVDRFATSKKGMDSSMFAPANAPTAPKITNATTLESMSNNGSDHQKRTRAWDRFYGRAEMVDPIVGPFEMQIWDYIPTEVYISEERLAQANIYLRDVQITFNRQNRRLIVGFAAQQGPGSVPARMEIVNVWQAVMQWMREVCSEIPSCLDDVVYRTLRQPATMPKGPYLRATTNVKEDAYNMPTRLREIGQEFPTMHEQLGPLLSDDFEKTRAGIENWLNHHLNPLRGLRAATADWLKICKSEDTAEVYKWSEQAGCIIRARASQSSTSDR
ncbi:hypothetical protein LZL87_008077 [Fusarium oxysporum]|nr:hypothetical protein LZL87_008077 [Fusarium oxysporum]